MIEIYKKSDFKEMPWKNGGGVTIELFRLEKLDSNSLLFRLSCATVSVNGPFSIYPNIDRILLLIKGNGFDLRSPNRRVELNKKFIPLTFKGEEEFSCYLLDGPSIDFNVMTDRHYANSTISVLHTSEDSIIHFIADCDLKFIYDMSHEVLYKLEKHDLYDLQVIRGSSLIIIDMQII